MSDPRPPIKDNPQRWKPNRDPASIEVPGLDTSASVSDQIDQIEQLITLKLQNIDENFSKIHNVLANRILPSVKRYAVATEPVREAAEFWKSFYEQAAQVRIPTADDYSTVNDQASERENPVTHESISHTTPQSAHQTFDHSISSTGSSFHPDAAFSSTPAAQRKAYVFDPAANDSDAMWSASESPIVRLGRELQQFSVDDQEHSEDALLSDASTHGRSYKPKDREPQDALLRSVLRQNIYTSDDTIMQASPSKLRGHIKNPIPKSFNPYIRPDSDAKAWSGVVDLRDPIIRSPQGYRTSRKPATPGYDDDDDSFALPPGMSPPRLIQAAMPKSAAKANLKLGRTPTREAAARITRDLVHGFPTDRYTDSSMSTLSSPPSMSRYAGTDMSSDIVGHSSMESLIQRVGLASTPALKLKPRTGRTPASQLQPQNAAMFSEAGFGTDSYGDPVVGTFRTPMHGQADMDDDDDDDDWPDNEVNNTAYPSAAFNLLLSEGRGRSLDDDDDSFGSSKDSFDDDVDVDIEPFQHQFNDIMDEDSFDRDDMDDEEEETLFGVNPAHRLLQEQDSNNLVLHGDQMFGDIGLTERLDNVAESPTNWARR